MIKYPKPVMRKSELEKMGFPKELLMRAYRSKGQTFAQKVNPGKRSSPIIFDTDGWERWRAEEAGMENKALRRV